MEPVSNADKLARNWEADKSLCNRINEWYEHEWQAGQEEDSNAIEIYEIIPDEPCQFVAVCDNDLMSEFIIEARKALPWWLEESAKLCKTIQEQQRYILSLEAEVKKYHKLHDDGYNEMRIMHDEKRKLREELTYEKSRNETYSNGVKLLEHQIQSIQKERDKLIEVMNWYATLPHVDLGDGTAFDTGGNARSVLEDIGVGEERT